MYIPIAILLNNISYIKLYYLKPVVSCLEVTYLISCNTYKSLICSKPNLALNLI